MHLPIKLPENSNAIRTTSNFIQHHSGYRKKKPAKIGRELINQGASTNLISRLKTPLSGHFDRILENLWRGRAIAKKNPAKIGRELINQGASTNLISRLKTSLSGHFDRILENLWRGRAIAKKNPAKIGRELINQGASTN
ncbi:hypothetical protein [Microcoleus sp. F10B5]|uniref:hypothetical protein n=1 Tax=Microcoleus sp. F10B5 TaxID=3055341 RepID=UPI002FD2E4B4